MPEAAARAMTSACARTHGRYALSRSTIARFAIRMRKVEVQRHEALPGAGLEVLQHALIARIVGNDQLKAGRGLDVSPVLSIGSMRRWSVSGMKHDHRVLPRLDDFVQIADGAFPNGAGQRAVLPHRAVVANQKSADEVAGVRSSWHDTVTSGRPRRHAMCSTNRVFPQPVGPFSMTARLLRMALLEDRDFIIRAEGRTAPPSASLVSRAMRTGLRALPLLSGAARPVAPPLRLRRHVETRRVPEEVIDEQPDADREDGSGRHQHQEVHLDLQLRLEIAEAE